MFKALLAGATGLIVAAALGGAAHATIVNQHMTPQQLTAYCGAVDAPQSSTIISLPGGQLVHGTVQCTSGAAALFCGDDDRHRRGGDDNDDDDRRDDDDDCYLIQDGQVVPGIGHHDDDDDDGHRRGRRGRDD